MGHQYDVAFKVKDHGQHGNSIHVGWSAEWIDDNPSTIMNSLLMKMAMVE